MVRWQIAAILAAMTTVAVTGAAMIGRSEAIEAEIGARARAALAPEATSFARVETDGRTVILTGAAPSADLRRMAAEKVGRLAGVRSVDDSGLGLLPEQSPYSMTLERFGAVLTMTGFAPSEPDRRRLTDRFTTALPDLAYNTSLRLARGVPDEGFLSAVDELVPLLAHVDRGRIHLEGRTVTIEGEAKSNGDYDRLTRLALALPEGYAVGAVTVARPQAAPFRWSVESDGFRATLSGVAPDPDVRLGLYGAVRGAMTRGAVIDQVDLASGAPDGFAEAAVKVAGLVGDFAQGRIEVSDGIITVAGTARSPESYRTLRAALDGWSPAGFSVTATVDLPTVAPFTLSASRSGPKVTVSGFIPSDAVAAQVKTAADRVAGLGGAVVETTLAGGAPEGFADAAVYAIRQLDHLSDGTVTVRDGAIAISGTAATGGDLLELEADAVTEVPADFAVTMDVTPPVVSPYIWSMERTEDQLILSGFVPSEDVRTAVREAVENISGDLGVADRTSLGAGLPENIDLPAVAAFAATEAMRLTSGHVTLNDDTLSIVGATDKARDGMAAVSAMAGRLPRAVKKGHVQVDFPPAYRFVVERGLDAVTIDGTVETEASKQVIADLAARAFGKADVILSLEVMTGLPLEAEAASKVAVRAASLVATGRITVENTVITVKGKAFTGVGAARLSSDIGGDVPRGYRLDTSVGVARFAGKVDAAECGRLAAEVVGRNAIYFADGAAVIGPESHGYLDRLGGIADRCADAPVTVETRAGAGLDATLAEARGKAVLQFLADVGVARERLTLRTVPEAGATAPGEVIVRIGEGAPTP